MPTCLLILILLVIPASGFAQQTGQGETQVENETDAANTTTIKVLPPAYETKMVRLSEVLGALHYIRELCGADEGQKWRDQMQKMIEAEEPNEDQKAKMIASFNAGFRGFQESYRECTPSAIEANNRYILEGGRLSAEIPTRYGR